MKSAIPTAKGVARTSANPADSNVPNTSGATYDTRPSPPGRSFAGALIAGHASTTRKTATPARTTRIRLPASTAAPEKTRSPGRWYSRCRGGRTAVPLLLTDILPARAVVSGGSLCRAGAGRAAGPGAVGCRPGQALRASDGSTGGG